MKKGELIDRLATGLGSEMNKARAELVLAFLVDTITTELVAGGEVSLVGFGTFSTRSRKGRIGQNPATGKSIEIPAVRTAKFKVGDRLKRAVKEATITATH